VGEPTELARYEISPGSVSCMAAGQRNGQGHDRPASGRGALSRGARTGADGYDALKALIADYISQARQLDEVDGEQPHPQQLLQAAAHA